MITVMAKRMPTLRQIGWDVAITDKGEVEFVEGNGNPDTPERMEKYGAFHTSGLSFRGVRPRPLGLGI